ncbi:MAG: nuclear transport factor 2 family protein [Saprospiraceae bacterium]|nr:nuclear transport factor 2 family protein [Saprospiraceae bacterium]
MKQLFILLLFILSSQIVFSQGKAETAVANTVETLRKAMVDADKSALENISAEELSYGHSSGKIENKSEFVEAIVSGKSDFVKIDLSDQTIKVVGKTALVRHKFFAETNDGGKPGTVTLHILTIWQKQKGGWKLLARQAVRVQ